MLVGMGYGGPGLVEGRERVEGEENSQDNMMQSQFGFVHECLRHLLAIT